MGAPDTSIKKPYRGPTMVELDPHEVIHKLMAQITGPLGATTEERIANAAEQIRGVLERLPEDERDEAIHEVVKSRGRWVKRAAWP
jgi:hypothetical protein